jgi:2-methylcitrate dehydratase PrpD
MSANFRATDGCRMTIAHELGNFVQETTGLSPAAHGAAVRAVFDLMTAAIGGFETPGGTAARNAARSTWGNGHAQLWFSSSRSMTAGAAFANAAIASMLDLDDGHRDAAGHPGAAVIPAVFAAADVLGADAEQVLTAIALGYEIGVRISAARDFDAVETFDSGLWCGQGVAVAIGWLRGLDAESLANAIAIAGTTAPAQSATPYTRIMGNNVKEGIPWATATGITAVELAARGFTGPIDLLDHESRFARAALIDGLGKVWRIEGVYFKPYSCCRWAHAAIDAALALQAQHGIAASSIKAINVATFSQVLLLNNEVTPHSLESAQYSVPFCVALAAVRGPEALLPMSEWSLRDSEVLALARRVRLSVDPQLDAMFSKSVPARIDIETEHASFVHTVLAPRGEPSNPMDWTDLKMKFDTVTRSRMSQEAAAQLVRAVEALERGDIKPLRAALATPLRKPARQQPIAWAGA